MRIATLERIKGLAPGETMIAYVGNLPFDIERCDKHSMQDPGAPKYKEMLENFRDELERLVKTKQIRLVRNESKKQRTSNRGTINDWRDFEYEVTKLIA